MSILKKTMLHRFPNRTAEINAVFVIFSLRTVSSDRALRFYSKVILPMGDSFWREIRRLLRKDNFNTPTEEYVMNLLLESELKNPTASAKTDAGIFGVVRQSLARMFS
ncbi:MAG: hypothetical protein WCT19_03720 [Candidatus Paceibacterota bacterium]|jgi:hypothetical protein